MSQFEIDLQRNAARNYYYERHKFWTGVLVGTFIGVALSALFL